ncbi:ASCH domain-containing protein [Catenuloplanes japonicus]|uniref:ASCH domain-containing protein n=1 Tax=Catenuloplanes japonicus TaxID=33876 RepID=UPI00052602A3|nr:ASCH domain-containing protein [Catenuloplanes japonicus]
MTSPKTLLLSLRPRFAAAILDGTKTIEIRRRPVNALPGTPVILYASSPVMAIVGTARLRTVESMPADMAWQRFQSSFALNRPEFDAYLDGVDTAVLLHLRAINTLNEPLPLRGLRQSGTFQPPQSFRYVAASDPAPLHRLALTA